MTNNRIGVTEVELFEGYWVTNKEYLEISSMSKRKQNKLIKDLKEAEQLKKIENARQINPRKSKK